MRKLLASLVALASLMSPAMADWTAKDAASATVTFKNPGVCTSVVCVPVVQLYDGTNVVTLSTAGADAVSNTLTGVPVYARNTLWNGTTWDRWTGDLTNGGWVNVKASALPSGAATSALQGTGNTSLSSIDGKTPALGQALAGASVPVILPAATITTLTPPTTVTANIGTAGTLALAANQTNATQKTQIVDGSGNVIAATSNAMNVAIVSGGGSGGTASSFAAAFPATGTATGMSQGGNMVAMTGTSGNLNVQCANCSGSGVSTVDAATFTASTSLFAGTGGFFQTTATANALTTGQQGMWQMTANRAGFVNLRDTAGTAIGTSAAEVFVGGRGTAGSAAGGVLTVQGVASMTPFLANPGTASLWGVNTLGSTTSGQSGSVSLGAVTTAAPTYTTAQSNALSLTTAGALRVDGSAVTQPVSGTVTTTPPSNASTNIAQINAVTPLMGNGVTGTGSQRVTIASDNTAFSVNAAATLAAETTKVIGTTRTVGNVGGVLDAIGQNAAAPANWMQMGCQFNTSPTTVTSGNGSPCQMSSGGHLLVAPVQTTTGADGVANTAGATVTSVTAAGRYQYAWPMLFNGTTWDRQRGTTSGAFSLIQDAAGNARGANVDASNKLTVSDVTAQGSLATIATNSGLPLPTQAVTNLVGGVGIDQTTDGTTNGVSVKYSGTKLVADPCQQVALVRTRVDIAAAASSVLVAGTASKKTYICGMMLFSAGTTNVGVVEGSGTTCGTSPLGLIGGNTAAKGLNMTAQAGFNSPPAGYAVAGTTVNANDICLINSAAIQVSGYIVTATP